MTQSQQQGATPDTTSTTTAQATGTDAPDQPQTSSVQSQQQLAGTRSKKEEELHFILPPNIERKRPPRYCRFKKYGIKHVDHKDVEFLLRFLNPMGRILPRRITGNSKKWQRRVAAAIKRARILGLLPFVTDSIEPYREQWVGTTPSVAERAEGGA